MKLIASKKDCAAGRSRWGDAEAAPALCEARKSPHARPGGYIRIGELCGREFLPKSTLLLRGELSRGVGADFRRAAGVFSFDWAG